MHQQNHSNTIAIHVIFAVALWNWTIREIFQWITKKLAHYQVMKVCKCVRPQPSKDQAYQRPQKNCYNTHQAQNIEAQPQIRCSSSHSFTWVKVCPTWIWTPHKQPITRCSYLEPHHPVIQRTCCRRVNVESPTHPRRLQGTVQIYAFLTANLLPCFFFIHSARTFIHFMSDWFRVSVIQCFFPHETVSFYGICCAPYGFVFVSVHSGLFVHSSSFFFILMLLPFCLGSISLTSTRSIIRSGSFLSKNHIDSIFYFDLFFSSLFHFISLFLKNPERFCVVDLHSRHRLKIHRYWNLETFNLKPV